MASSARHARDEPDTLRFVALLAGSIAVHAVLVWSMNTQSTARAPRRTVEMAFFEAPRHEPKRAEVETPAPTVRRVRVVATAQPPAPPAPPSPATPTAAMGGVTPESETPIGTFVLPPGNTVFAPAVPRVIAPPRPPSGGSNENQPGSADVEPTLVGEVKVDYPADARMNEVEGAVRLRVTTDERGVVTNVVVISGPGYGLDEAAREALKRFTFKPARKDGEAVRATFTYTYRFELD